MAAPPWTSLRELEHASQEFENDMLQDRQALQWINMLIAPGASLGGARPKASVTDEQGQLCSQTSMIHFFPNDSIVQARPAGCILRRR